MEETVLSLTLVACALSLLALCCTKVFYSFWWKPKSLERQLNQQGIKGNPYRFLFGDMKDEVNAMIAAWSKPMDQVTHQIVPRAAPLLHQTVERYGKMSITWVGPRPRVNIWDVELMRDVLLDRKGQFKKPTVNPLVKLLVEGVATLEGEEWANRRKIINPAFHLDKLKEMVSSFQASVIDMIKRWQDLAGTEGSFEIDVWPELQSLTGEVISRTAFGSSYEEGKKIFEIQNEQIVLMLEANRTPYIPGMRFIPTAKNRRRMHNDREIKRILKGIIEKKLNSMKNGMSTRDDLLNILLQSSSCSKDPKGYRLTNDEVIDECKLFYLAGNETTSVLLTWTLLLLAHHPSWQLKAREEVLRVCGESTPNFESINHLKIVNMILHEVLRLYPSINGVFRHTTAATKIGDYCLPEGVEVFLPTILIHHDKELWGASAEEFNPERFSEGVSKASKVPNAYFPFGWGPRICLGQNFAMIEAKIALSSILQHFSFELSPSYAHAPYTLMTLQPQYGLQIIFQRLGGFGCEAQNLAYVTANHTC